ncbi:NAD(P)/FAD-dependent oxidoreductase [Paraliomyxa miuraensis]|uniref:NAD(P)/FAD-dependent oxidoreductase n=1 Tax=Paraliomyxa miuraensis TaxID=376150 RepID=UPI00224FB8A3|nr:FAD-dependent oxidoreductase [Paraliomyxa miuraensis]MCX4244796.1 FAD-dependent oxidoreductase [Paraliomyxa miuraensis]
MSSEAEGGNEGGGGDLPRRRDGGVAHRCDVVVLGASFAGIEVLLQLQRRSGKALQVVVVDRQERHGYIPLVHERLCGRMPMEATELATAEFVGSLPGARFIEDEVVAFDPVRKLVTLGSGTTIVARFVVVALGSTLAPPPSLPGGERLLRYKQGDELQRARERLDRVLRVETGDPPRLVVVGGGISGVELAGELAHLRRQRPDGWRVPAVTLVSAGERLLPELAAGVGRKAAAVLRAEGVELRLGTRLTAVEPGAVRLRGDSEESLPCAAALWAGGIRPAPVLEHLGLPRTEAGWLEVGPTLQCFPLREPSAEVFACGDAVRVVGGTGEWPTMQRAIECLWQAKLVARNVLALMRSPEQGLTPHVLRPRFAYGVSLGGRSLVVYGGARVELPGINVWFRRWLMRQYFDRYAPWG